MMNFSNRELTLIGDLQRMLHSYQREWITLPELAAGLLHEVALADVDRVLPHCMALLSRDARPDVEACLDRLASSDYQEILVFYVGPGLSEPMRAWLRPRYRAVCLGIIDYYRRFGDRTEFPRELAVPAVDRFWELLRGMASEDGSKCRTEGCDLPTVRVSVFCARHHYERIEGKSPPQY